MRYKWEKYNWWILCIIITITLFVMLHCIYPNTDPENARYILSAISQGLAAILALVFTITLIAVQMTRSYTAMDQMFKSETVIFMLVFAIGIVLPLIILKTGSDYVNGCIVLATFCVLSLIPHLKEVNATLKYDIAPNNLREEAMNAIRLAHGTTAINKIEDLAQLGVSAAEDMREKETSNITRLLVFLGEKAAEKGMHGTTNWAVDSLSEVGKMAAKKKLEDAAKKAVDGLISIGEKSINNKWKDVIKNITDGLISIGVMSAKKGMKDVIRNASGFLEKVAVNFARQEEGLNSASGLWILGAAVEKYLIEIVDEWIRKLRNWENSTSNDFFEKAFNRASGDINEHYPNLKQSFKEFERRYK